jgi:uncharacterized membrane protein (UPF0127 family)
MIFCCKNSENIIVSHKTVIARSVIDRAFGLIVRKFDENLDGMIFENGLRRFQHTRQRVKNKVF